jgi:CRISPR-associated protein Cas6
MDKNSKAGWKFVGDSPTYEFVLDARGTVARDHGWLLYGALCAHVPIHGRSDTQVAPLTGKVDDGKIHASAIVVRAPLVMAPQVMALAGQRLMIGKDELIVGGARMTTIRPRAALASRLVYYHNAETEGDFWPLLERSIADLGVTCEVTLGKRRVLRVKDNHLFGWSVKLTRLSPADSVKVKVRGMGSGRRFGCGVFA